MRTDLTDSRLNVTVTVLTMGAIAVAIFAFGLPGRSPDPKAIPSSGKVDQTTATEFHNNASMPGFDDPEFRLKKLQANGSATEIEALLREIAQHQPEFGIELARSVARTEAEASNWTCMLVATWAGRNSEAAWLWLEQQTDRPEVTGNTTLLSLIFDQMAIQRAEHLVDISDACLRTGNPSGGFEPQIMAHTCMDALIKNGSIVVARDTAAQWMRKLDPKAIGSSALEAVAVHLAQSAPLEAAGWLQTLPISEARNVAMATLASDWATRDPLAAMEWAGKLRAEEGRAEVMQRAFGEWVERDPARAAEWLDHERARISNHLNLDQMVTHLIAASPMVQTDGAGALQWAALIAEPSLRSDLLSGVFSRWMYSDRPLATRHLKEDLELTPGQKSKILKSYWEARAAGEAGE
jgi:hypothetical protein